VAQVLTECLLRWGVAYRRRYYLNGNRISERVATDLLARKGGISESTRKSYGWRTDWQLGTEN
jgi:hypothetical protein